MSLCLTGLRMFLHSNHKLDKALQIMDVYKGLRLFTNKVSSLNKKMTFSFFFKSKH